jgi:phage-related tail protein
MAKDAKWKAAARRAAKQAKQAADHLMKVAKQRVESSDAKQRLKRALQKAGRVLKAASAAAVRAGIAAGKKAAKD